MKILQLTLHKRWFDEIASGLKNKEYRSVKAYWNNRLLDDDGEFRCFDEVWFTNGYGSTRPFMRVEYIETNYENYEGEPCFSISLGDILELRNMVG